VDILTLFQTIVNKKMNKKHFFFAAENAENRQRQNRRAFLMEFYVPRCDIIVKCWDEFMEKDAQLLSCEVLITLI